jgi:hypothetical protein
LLSSIPTASGKTRTYSGFDISPKQLPKSPIPGLDFSLHNLLEPYPEELHGLYDLVYVRLVCLVFREDQLKTVVANLISLLSKPLFIP